MIVTIILAGGVNVCRRSQSDYSECLTRLINKHWSSWVLGNSHLQIKII